MRAAATIPPLSSQSQDALWHIHYPRPSSCGWQWVFVRLTLVSCWWIQDEKAAGLRVVVYAWVCLCQLSACTNCMDLIAHWWYNCNVELIWTQWSCWGIFLTITDIFPCGQYFSAVYLAEKYCLVFHCTQFKLEFWGLMFSCNWSRFDVPDLKFINSCCPEFEISLVFLSESLH